MTFFRRSDGSTTHRFKDFGLLVPWVKIDVYKMHTESGQNIGRLVEFLHRLPVSRTLCPVFLEDTEEPNPARNDFFPKPAYTFGRTSLFNPFCQFDLRVLTQFSPFVSSPRFHLTNKRLPPTDHLREPDLRAPFYPVHLVCQHMER